MSDDLAARRELVKLYRGYAAQDPSQLLELAATLQDFADAAQSAGQLKEALSASAEAIEIRRRAVSGGAWQETPKLAGSLVLRARWLFIAKREAEGERVLSEAASVHMDMIGRLPADRLIYLAQALMQTAVFLKDGGDFRVCAAVCDWAIAAAQRARAVQPDAVIFVSSLLTLKSWALSGQGSRKQALSTAKESLALAEEYARFDLDGSIGGTARQLVDFLTANSR